VFVRDKLYSVGRMQPTAILSMCQCTFEVILQFCTSPFPVTTMCSWCTDTRLYCLRMIPCPLRFLPKQLLEAKADINAAEVGGATPLFIAASNDHTEVCRLLISSRASLGGCVRMCVVCVCMCVCVCVFPCRYARACLHCFTCSLCLARCANFPDLKACNTTDVKMPSGASPLFVAASNGYNIRATPPIPLPPSPSSTQTRKYIFD